MNISLELRKCQNLISSLNSNYVLLNNIERQLTSNKKIINDIIMINDEMFSNVEYTKIINSIRQEANKIQRTLLPSAKRAYNELLAMLEEE